MNVLIINAGIDFSFAEGRLNKLMTDIADKTLTEMGYSVRVTALSEPYQVSDEIDKYQWANTVIYQQPGWWMGPPWILKKYLDEVLTQSSGILYQNDGRTRSDSSCKYGSGGIPLDKKYMISATWNAPLEAFIEKDQFFEGKGLDGIYFPFHKIHEFISMTPITSFACYDVVKETNIKKYTEDYEFHLKKYFKK